jgi:hypothetical protein
MYIYIYIYICYEDNAHQIRIHTYTFTYTNMHGMHTLHVQQAYIPKYVYIYIRAQGAVIHLRHILTARVVSQSFFYVPFTAEFHSDKILKRGFWSAKTISFPLAEIPTIIDPVALG